MIAIAAQSFLRTAWLVAVLLCLCVGARAEEAPALKGVALVIGQSAYTGIPALPNPANDARAMVKLLTDLGFDARSVTDRDARKLKRDLERFVEDAEGADVAFLYYSGHGIEAGGENWLVPVEADAASLADAAETLVPLSAVLDELKQVVPVTILLLDACRTNPFPPGALVRKDAGDPGAPVATEGLTPVRGVKALGSDRAVAENLGTVIGFAAEPGRPALDGTAGGNSPYTTALLRHLGALEGVEFGAVMRMVTEEVYLETAARQRPWVNESLRRLLYFGVPQPAPTGEDGLITGERRQLLLTISTLPQANRVQVETVAARGGVPLGALYGVLRALGEDRTPQDPAELETVLQAQAGRLRGMIAERDALRTDDPEIARLTGAADRAIAQGAIVAARTFLDDAVVRVEATSGAVDAAEEAVKQKRIADAAIYAQRAAASALAFDYAAAADDYRQAFDLVEKWDERLTWNYKNLEAESLHAHGAATGSRGALRKAIDAYRAILRLLPDDEPTLDRAITRNNMAVVLQTLGERETGTDSLEEALLIFRDSLAVFEREKDDLNWAAAQNNIGNTLLRLGQRDNGTARLQEAVAAFRAALGRRDRATVPLDWASSQNNLGIALFSLAEREPGSERLVEAEAAYRAALEEYTRAAAPLQWAMVQNNLGNTLNALGARSDGTAQFERAAEAFLAGLEVRTRDDFPLQWAASQLNLGNAYANIGRLELGTDTLARAELAYRAALEVFTRDASAFDWASAQNNLGSVLQTLGQRTGDVVKIEDSAAAFRAALEEYTRTRVPLDWAMANFNLGNSLQLVGQFRSDAAVLKQAVEAYHAALSEFRREDSARSWALAQAGLGSVLQSLAGHEAPVETLREAIAARRAALEVLTRDTAPIEWATAQNGLGTCLLNLATFTNDGAPLPAALAAFEAATEVFTRDSQPLQWAFAINNIGDVHWSLAARGGGTAEYEAAIAQFETAKQGFQEAGYLPPVALLDQKIALIQQAMAK
jgi:uncharacterized caspase-like protein